MYKFIKKFIERLAESNEKNFGCKRLDCCDINRNSNLQAIKNATKK